MMSDAESIQSGRVPAEVGAGDMDGPGRGELEKGSDPGESARTRLAGAIAVRRAITSCYRCSLRLECTAPVPFRGPLEPVLAILGEAPGRNEDVEGRPFVGPAGKFLEDSLRAAGFDNARCAFLNSANCYPATTGTPTSEHVERCRVHLVGQLNALSPSHLLTVGVTAFNAVMSDHKRIPLRTLLGRPWWLDRLEPWPCLARPITVLSTYHPAARSPSQKLRMKEDISFLWRWMKEREPFPGTCLKCPKEVDHWDDHGIAWCADHKGIQGALV